MLFHRRATGIALAGAAALLLIATANAHAASGGHLFFEADPGLAGTQKTGPRSNA